MILFNNANAIAAASASVVNPAQVPADRIAAFNPDDYGAGTVNLNGAAAAGVRRVQFVQGGATGEPPLISPIINLADVVQTAATAYVAPAAQVSVVGFTGSGTGNIGWDNSTDYNLKVVELFDTEQHSRKNYGYRSGAAATPTAIADGLMTQINAVSDSAVKATVLSDATTTALDNAVTLTVVNGSNIVVGSGTNHGAVAGSYLRIGHATTKTFPVYRITAVDGANITLSSPYQGASASAVAAGDAAAPANTVIAGLRLEGKEVGAPFMTALNEGFDTTVTVTAVTAPASGTGSYAQVAEMEEIARSVYGDIYRLHLRPDYAKYADPTHTYDLHSIRFGTPTTKNISLGRATIELYLAIEATASGINLATFFGK